ncbi:MAG: protein kinase domain-containing protein [Terriglobia bacterium]
MFSSKTQPRERYDLANRTLIGRGGMGVVYKVYDFQLNKYVALKTLRDVPSRNALRMFERERDALVTLNHANIVDVYDVGELEEEGARKPFFVMTRLEGMPLDKVIRTASQRLTVERVVGILLDICKGLQAAHNKGIVHRDLKPSNIFVMEDDSVKIIDFGLAHMLENQLTQAGLGTPYYMSPEQIERKELTSATDIFSLGVVAYELFSLKRPFDKPSADELARAILHDNPQPLWQLNQGVNQVMSQVVQKALAKMPQYRYAAASEFADKLRMAFRNEPIAAFDIATIRPRLVRARAAFERRDYAFACEILDELATEGRIDAEVFALRELVNRALRQEKVQELIAAGRRGLDEEEFTLATQKVREALKLDPENAAALGLKHSIDDAKIEKQVRELLLQARGDMAKLSFDAASQSLQQVLDLKPGQVEAHQLRSEMRLRQEDLARVREQKLLVYDTARLAWQNSDLDTALEKMEEVLRLDQGAPEPDRSSAYQGFYEQVRSERDELLTARTKAAEYLDRGEYNAALAACAECVARYPNSVPLQVLKFEIEEQARRALSKFTSEVNSRLESEPDVDKRVLIAREAVRCYPTEPYFQEMLKGLERRRQLVNGVVAKARLYENRAQWADAVAQWETLRTVHPSYPALDAEIQRATDRRNEQALLEFRSQTLAEIRRCIERADYEQGAARARDAERGFPGDQEIRQLRRQAEEATARAQRAETSLSQAATFCQAKRLNEAIAVLRETFCLDRGNSRIRTALSDAWVEKATELIETNWRASESPLREALEVDPDHAMAKSLLAMISDRKQQELRDQSMARAQPSRHDSDLGGELAKATTGPFSTASEAELAEPRAPVSGTEKQDSTRLLDGSAIAHPGLENETEAPAHGASSMLLTPPPAQEPPGDAPTLGLDVVLAPVARNDDPENRQPNPKPARRPLGTQRRLAVAAVAVAALGVLIYWLAGGSHSARPAVVQRPKLLVARARLPKAHPALAPLPGAIGVVVRDSIGRPLAHAEITVMGAAGQVVAKSRSDRRGKFQISGLSADTYIVEVKAPPGYGDGLTQSVVLGASQRADLSLRFKKKNLIASKTGAPTNPGVPAGISHLRNPAAEQLAPTHPIAARPPTLPSSGIAKPGPPTFVNPEAVIDFVTSPPTNSEILIDGVARGKGPRAVEVALKLGNHLLEIQPPPGWLPVKSALQITKVTAEMLTISLEKSGGSTLGVTTSPPGASIYVDGALQSRTTPVELVVSSGHHVIVVSKPGCAPVRGEVDVSPGRVFNFGRQLQCR